MTLFRTAPALTRRHLAAISLTLVNPRPLTRCSKVMK
jgi:hypothetical protein